MTTAATTAAFIQAVAGVLVRPDFAYVANRHAMCLAALRHRGGRLFCVGVGGGAANAAHAVNDFRKLCNIEAYAPTDGIAELTARVNDDGWKWVFEEWLRVSNMRAADALYVYSVGGGKEDVSSCITRAVRYAGDVGAPILGVVGRGDGATAKFGTSVLVTHISGDLLTPVTETVQVAMLHALVSDPRLQLRETRW